MKLNLKFQEKDFNSFRDFEKAVVRQTGNNAYVSTDNICVYFALPPKLKAMLYPFADKGQMEFELDSNK